MNRAVAIVLAMTILAVDGDAAQRTSATAGSRRPVTIPAPPADLVATVLCATRLELRWRDVATTESGYLIARRGAAGPFTALATLPRDSTSFLDVGLVPETEYDYLVLALGRAPSLPAFASAATPGNEPPTVSVALPASSRLVPGVELRFSVTVDDPDGDRVSLTLAHLPPGLVFDPVRDEVPPVTRGVRWTPVAPFGGRRPLVFEARDCVDTVEERITFVAGESTTLVGDVSGDGVGDVVAVASSADVGGVANVGAVYVWRGGAAGTGGPPTATLLEPGAGPNTYLGSVSSGEPLLLADVTGDGVLDVVVSSAGTNAGSTPAVGSVLVWAGGATLVGTPAPTATLTTPAATAFDRLGLVRGQGLFAEDVTGDGVRDVVVGGMDVDVGGVVDAGLVQVWAGGPSLTGKPSPTASLSLPQKDPQDRLGAASDQGLLLGDVTGDGVLDLVVGALWDDVAGVQDAGSVAVWQGGPGLAGAAAPRALLQVVGAAPDDQLADVGGFASRAIQLVDLSGDGVLDVLCGAVRADVGGVADTGALYLWKGGAALVGTPAPHATLTVPGAAAGDQVGHVPGQGGVLVGDVTGDGRPDVVAGASLADVDGVVDAGAAYVWSGAVLAGAAAPNALLVRTEPVVDDRLGKASGAGLLLADLTGDGVLDVVVEGSEVDVAGTPDVGAVHVWPGGPALEQDAACGARPQPLELTVPGAAPHDRLGSTRRQGVQLADLDGDGVLDVLACAPFADVGGASGVGALYLWRGGAGRTSGPPEATLLPAGATPGASLGWLHTSEGVELADVSGDGVLDVVAGSQFMSLAGKVNAGSIHVWHGGAGLAGTPPADALLSVPAGGPGDQLCLLLTQGVQVADVTGDGRLDVVSGTRFADHAGVPESGALYVWPGELLPAGTAPGATLFVAGARVRDRLGQGGSQGVQLADLNGDGVLDVLGAAWSADPGGVTDAGSLHLWRGGPTLAGDRPSDGDLTVPGAAVGDRLTR